MRRAYEILYTKVFCVAEYESKDMFSKFKMTDLIWRMKRLQIL